METMAGSRPSPWPLPRIPWFGARKLARSLAAELQRIRGELDSAKQQLASVSVMSVLQLETRRDELERETESLRKDLQAHRERMDREDREWAARIEKEKAEAKLALEAQLETRRDELERETEALRKDLQAHCERMEREDREWAVRIEKEKAEAKLALEAARTELELIRQSVVETEDLALLQEVGIYHFRHPLTDVVAYQTELEMLETKMWIMARKEGGAVLASTSWTVNGSASEGRAMVGQCSKLMLRAFNAEADTLIRWLKPYKLDAALSRLKKTADAIERLGKTMQIRIAPAYYELRVKELELTADFLQKQAEQKEAERLERERIREERKAQRELEAERVRLAKERQHHVNALQALIAKNDEVAAARLREQLAEIDRAIENVDFRAANTRAGYVYLISNIGSFGPDVVKLGMTRRLDPLDRIRELSDASVPFNFDVHALFFSKDAVGIETVMHSRLEKCRVNTINRRREFFRVTPVEVKSHLSELAGELLEFKESPEALEYRQSLLLKVPELPSEALSPV